MSKEPSSATSCTSRATSCWSVRVTRSAVARTSSGIAVGRRVSAGLRKRQQLSCQQSGPLRQVNDVLQKLAQRRRQVRLAQAQSGIAVDARQQVVELVSHAARQRADRLHLLSLTQLTLELVVGRHVALDADEVRQALLGVEDGRDGQRRLEQAAILAAVGQFALPALAVEDGAPHFLIQLGRMAAALEQVRRMAAQFVAAVTGQIDEGLVDVEDAAAQVGNHDAVAGRLQGLNEQQVELLQTVLGDGLGHALGRSARKVSAPPWFLAM